LLKRFSKQTLNDFAAVGLSHVLAISGYNIAMVIGILESLLEKRLSKKPRLILIILLVVFFSIFTGAGVSVIRAAVKSLVGEKEFVW